MVYLKPEFSKAEFQHLHWLQSIIQQWLESWLDTRESDSYSWLFKYFILFSYSDVQEGHLAGYKRSLISVQVTDLFAMHSYSPEGSNQGVSQQRSKPHTHHLQEKKKKTGKERTFWDLSSLDDFMPIDFLCPLREIFSNTAYFHMQIWMPLKLQGNILLLGRIC